MAGIEDFIASLLGSNTNANTLYATNQSERDGNPDDLLLRIDQAAVQTGIGISGGTTLTNLSPYTAISDLQSGKVSLAVIVWLLIAGGVGWFLLRK